MASHRIRQSRVSETGDGIACFGSQQLSDRSAIGIQITTMIQRAFERSAIGGFFSRARRHNCSRSELDRIENYFIGLVGFEPTACRRGDRSTRTVELHVPLCGICSTILGISGWWDLNPRPPGPEPGALPS